MTPRFRLSLVRETDPTYPDTSASNPAAVARLAWLLVEDEPAEVLGAIWTDTRNCVIGTTIAYRGTINRAAVEPRGIFAPALLANASGVILFHNHPSGDPSPSAEDLAFTRRCAEAGEILGIPLIDHVIVGSADRWVSLRTRGGW